MTTSPDKNVDSGRRQTHQTKIRAIAVGGFKSFAVPVTAIVRPLTILAGANSSGKSSLIQPLLLIKQTLESAFHPGPLKLGGPNVHVTSADQVLCCAGRGARGFNVTIVDRSLLLRLAVDKSPEGALGVCSVEIGNGDESMELLANESYASVLRKLKRLRSVVLPSSTPDEVDAHIEFDRTVPRFVGSGDATVLDLTLQVMLEPIWQAITDIIHVPGLRGNPERTYSRTGAGPKFPGRFESYTATVLHEWQKKSRQNVQAVSEWLRDLGLTSQVNISEVDQTQLEIKVGRLTKSGRGGARDLVSIADVGFGVSQVLPVLVALQVAKPGQLVYIEQPELHLHPRAQGAIASVLADAARRGVHVVAETHSQELLLAVQTLVAEGTLDSTLVKLHWFERGPDGFSKVTSADLDDTGAFGDWPVDFADVTRESQNRYLDAAEAKLATPAD